MQRILTGKTTWRRHEGANAALLVDAQDYYRALTVDSEINAAWVASKGDHVMHNAIRRVRTRLLVEHLGEAADVRLVARPENLVAQLNRAVHSGTSRLRHHELQHDEPNVFAKAMQELACDFVDPEDGAEPLPPPSSFRIPA